VPAFGNVWNFLAQSFTAEDRRISFGFRMLDASAALPNAGVSIEYSLYAGENSFSSSTLLARRVVLLPSTLASDPRSVFGDLGFVDADFTDVELTPGEKYTVLVGRSGLSLPVLGTTTGFGVWTSLSNPYSGGRFFFPVGYAGWAGQLYNNDFFSQDDMLFRITPASVSAPLAIVAPPAITVAADVGRCDAQVNLGTPTTAGGTPPITLAATPAGPYSVGNTTVTWTATDASSTTASATQLVTVGEQELPHVVAPPNVSTVTDPGKPTASVSPGVATATDNCPGVTVTGARNDGQAVNAPYPLGQTIITWTATDASANTANASQTVTVADQEPPTLVVPADIVVNATSPVSAVVTYEVIARDNVAVASLNCTPASGATFPLGTTTVTCMASDPSGNRASATFHVAVLSPQIQISNFERVLTTLALSRGTITSLLTKLNDALAAASAGDVAAACASLQDFINETQAQAGKKISISDANTLSAGAQRIRAVLGC
jgi:hypothetical protein